MQRARGARASPRHFGIEQSSSQRLRPAAVRQLLAACRRAAPAARCAPASVSARPRRGSRAAARRAAGPPAARSPAPRPAARGCSAASQRSDSSSSPCSSGCGIEHAPAPRAARHVRFGRADAATTPTCSREPNGTRTRGRPHRVRGRPGGRQVVEQPRQRHRQGHAQHGGRGRHRGKSSGAAETGCRVAGQS